MTAEIAIMNQQAVALAADSAVTGRVGDNQKIFPSQDKLFSLSESAPVGILVYGNASFMSIPWETLIKEYRRQLAKKTFDHFDSYVNDFCTFLSKYVKSHITSSHKNGYLSSLVDNVFSEMDNTIRQAVSQVIEELAEADPQNVIDHGTFLLVVREAYKATVADFYERARDAETVLAPPAHCKHILRSQLRRQVRDFQSQVPGDPVDRENTRQLIYIALRSSEAFLDDIIGKPAGETSGVVIAGFGNKDLYPAYSEVLVEGLVFDRLKKRQGRSDKCGPVNSASIVGFAQDDVVYAFMQGMDPVLMHYLDQSLALHFELYTDALLDGLDKYSSSEKESLRDSLKANSTDIVQAFLHRVELTGREQVAEDILSVVGMLPKNELGEMAEALVSLTSLKRKVSRQDETVGGPIDVAIITKGDGLVWTKRKHYFPSDLNPAYFARIYSGG